VAEEGTERRLAAIMSADVAGYSRLMGKDEAGTLSALKALRKDVFAPQVTAHKGRVVKLMGDGALVEFPSVVNAVDCGIAVQRVLAERASGEQIKLRIGINLGDIIIEGSDIYGDGVNVAARIQEVAEPGGIALSGAAFDQVAGKVEATFADGGEQQLKNIAKPVGIYHWSDDGADRRPEKAGTQEPLPLVDKPSIAVLPFVNMSGDPEQEYFSDGITEDIITELARFSSLFVIARNSSFHYKGQSPNIQDVGSELGVEYVVEGSVRRAGDRVRITAQLIDAASGNHVWGERYDRDLKDIFAVQDEVVREIATAVPGQLDVAAINRVERRSDQDLTAYEYVLRGERMRNQDWASPDAIPLFERAIEADPQCARAYAQIANWHAYSIQAHCVPAEEAGQVTRDLAEKALRIEPNDPVILGFLAEAYVMSGDLDLARRCIDKAIRINPNHYYVMIYAAEALAWLGDVDEALRWRDLYVRHDPLSSAALAEVEFEIFYLTERYEDAIQALAGWQNLPIHLLAESAAAHAQAGRLEEAAALRKQFESRLPPGYTIKDHVSAISKMCALQEHRDIWLEGYRNAGFDV
jgi:TolB-like protein/class 3 adenylate cyclase